MPACGELVGADLGDGGAAAAPARAQEEARAPPPTAPDAVSHRYASVATLHRVYARANVTTPPTPTVVKAYLGRGLGFALGSHRVNALPVVYKRLSLGLELLLLLLEEALPLGHASCLKLDLCLALS